MHYVRDFFFGKQKNLKHPETGYEAGLYISIGINKNMSGPSQTLAVVVGLLSTKEFQTRL